MKHQTNKGKYCSISGCKNKARVKGLCTACYNLKRKKDMDEHLFYQGRKRTNQKTYEGRRPTI